MANTPEPAKSATVLKLLSGPQLGAEIPLDDGEYLIGSSDDCDIVLLDGSVAARHVLLNKSAGKINISAQDQAVLIGAQTLASGESADLPAGTVIGLGTTYLGLGPPDTDWLNLPLPRRPASIEQTGDEAAAADPVTPESGQEPTPRQSTAVSMDKSARHIAPWIVAGTVIILTFFMAFFRYDISAWLRADPRVNVVIPSPSLDNAKTILAKVGMKGIEVSEDARGDIVLRGYSDTEAAKQRLLSALKKADIPIISHIWAADTLQRALQDTLNRLGAGQLQLDYLGQGAIRLHGFFDADIAKEELIAILRQDIPAISRIDAEIRTLGDSVADLRRRVRDVGLGDLIEVVADEKNIFATGELDSEQSPLWQTVMGAFTATTQGIPALRSYVKVRDDELPGEAEASEPVAMMLPEVDSAPRFHGALKLKVRGIVMGDGKPPYALLGDGLRVSKGDVVGENYVIDAIRIDGVVVRNGSQTYVYYIGDGS
ncbi:MAG: type III secretion system inner membrane ring subunit SctD [Candidatus Competibacteraceae bacterium]|nr:type III secretion system inner membrane ring subunit SctD [Candidatus Competibacteraceae bacterium]